MTCNELMATKEPQHLAIFSILTKSTGSMLLLSPHQPSYWSAICDNPEWWGSVPDPLNRWLHKLQGPSPISHSGARPPIHHVGRGKWLSMVKPCRIGHTSEGRPFGVLSQRFRYRGCNLSFTPREPLPKPHTALHGGLPRGRNCS